MSKRTPELYLRDILESIESIEHFLMGEQYKDFVHNRMLFSATVRELEIIGEAVGKLPQTIKEQYPQIAWRDIKDFRNLLSHEYFGVDAEIVWDVVSKELPLLKTTIQQVLN